MTRRLNLQFHSTKDLFHILQQAERREVGRYRLGDEPSYTARAAAAVQEAQTALFNTATLPFGLVWAKVKTAQADLQNMASDALKNGATTAGDVLNTLASRVSQAADTWSKGVGNSIKNLGTGAGDAYREFFGIPPWAVMLLGVVVLGGAGYLLVTPAGQTVLSGGGKALARLAMV